MRLFYAPGACSLSPHIVLSELGLRHDLTKVSTKTRKTDEGGDYLKVNAKGYVPTLQLDDGQYLTEGPAIVQYLADRAPDSGLAPANGTLQRYRLQEWLNFITSEVHKQFSPLFAPGVTDAVKEAQTTKLSGRFDWISQQLEGKDYLLGKQFTVADAYLFTVLRWSGFVGIDLSRWPTLQQYVARVGARPKVQEALKAEGLTA